MELIKHFVVSKDVMAELELLDEDEDVEKKEEEPEQPQEDAEPLEEDYEMLTPG